ncbi:MAG: pilus assembly protein TadG-related protein [Pseudomonadota bacterium]
MRGWSQKRLAQFAGDERGSFLLLVLALFILMALSIGMAIDFMRHETARADLQNALDRGVLAAAALTQKAATEVDLDDDGVFDALTDAEIQTNYQNLVANYMASRSFNPSAMTLNVTPTEVGNTKTVFATATYKLPTTFLALAGKTVLDVRAESFARQSFSDVEVSLVFDISGSMEDNDVVVGGVTRTRLAQAKIDAQNFVTDAFNRDLFGGELSMSLIPYSSKVSIPPGMAAAYNLQPAQGATALYTDHYCFDFNTADFTSITIDKDTAYQQFPLFKVNNSHWSCPKAGNEIKPLSVSAGDVNTAIQGLTRESWTSVYEGVKWGSAMLDPNTREALPTMMLGENPVIPPGQSHLPRDFDPTRVTKVLVVMSDGRNTQTPQMLQDEYLKQSDDSPVEGEPHDYWRTRVPDRVYNQRNGDTEERYWTCNNREVANVPATEDDPAFTVTGAITKFSNDCPVTALPVDSGFGVPVSALSDTTLIAYEDGEDVNEPDALLYEVCDRAKENGIVIYTIAFELAAGSRGARALRECASGDSRAYEVGGYNLNQAFDAILADISNLKLTSVPVDESSDSSDVADDDSDAGDETDVDVSDSTR